MTDKRIVIDNFPMDKTLQEFLDEFSGKFADPVVKVEVVLVVEEKPAVSNRGGTVRYFVCGPVTACRQAGRAFTRLA